LSIRYEFFSQVELQGIKAHRFCRFSEADTDVAESIVEHYKERLKKHPNTTLLFKMIIGSYDPEPHETINETLLEKWFDLLMYCLSRGLSHKVREIAQEVLRIDPDNSETLEILEQIQ